MNIALPIVVSILIPVAIGVLYAFWAKFKNEQGERAESTSHSQPAHGSGRIGQGSDGAQLDSALADFGNPESRRLDLYSEWLADESVRYAEERRAEVRRARSELVADDGKHLDRDISTPRQASPAQKNCGDGQTEKFKGSLAASFDLCQSEPERLLLQALVEIGQLQPTCDNGKLAGGFGLDVQATIKTSTWLTFHPDFLINDRLIVEVDGHKYHSDRVNHVRDRQRDRILKRQGYETLRFAAVEVLENPSRVAEEVLGFIRPHEPRS